MRSRLATMRWKVLPRRRAIKELHVVGTFRVDSAEKATTRRRWPGSRFTEGGSIAEMTVDLVIPSQG